MNQQERELIQSLFDRLEPAAAQSKDVEAEALIAQRVAANRAAPYLLSQMAIVHEHALQGAQNRIAELEAELAEAKSGGEKGGSFLGGLIGGTAWARKETPSRAATAAPGAIRMPNQPLVASRAGSVPAAGPRYAGGPSFLQSALTTAAGVAGGMVLGSMLSNMLFHNPGSAVAAAAQPPASTPAGETPDNTPSGSPWSTAHEQTHVPPDAQPDPGYDTAQAESVDTDFGSGGDFGGGDGGGGGDYA